MAIMLNTSRETVSQAITELVQAGVVERPPTYRTQAGNATPVGQPIRRLAQILGHPANAQAVRAVGAKGDRVAAVTHLEIELQRHSAESGYSA